MNAKLLIPVLLPALLAVPQYVAASSRVPDLQRSVTAAKHRVYPSLVNITVVSRYFEEGRTRRAPAGGSGVIVTPQGHVLTNYHVAGRSTRIRCTLSTGQVMDASVVVHDPLTDLSVLKISSGPRGSKGRPLPAARLGNSDNLQVGEMVLSMGNPLMLSSSVTMGIISNTKRVFTDFIGTDMEDMTLDAGERTGLFTRWIQHDALILPGNSGGPLVNAKGEVIGINELGGSGIGFAIPANIARSVLQQALRYHAIRRGYLGVSLMPVDKLGRKDGVLIASIAPDTPAAKSGFRPGDVMLSVNGASTTARFFEQVPLVYEHLAGLRIGTKAHVILARAGKRVNLTLTVATMPSEIDNEEESRDLGITIERITPEMAFMQQLGTINGVLVTGVRQGYPCESAQPKVVEGDIITSVAGKPTRTLAEFRKAAAAANHSDVGLVLLRRDEQIVTVAKKNEEPSPEGGELAKAWLGIKTQVVTPEIASVLKVDPAQGFRITQVFDETQAARAGLKAGDILTELNGSALEASRPQDSADLRNAIEQLSVGEDVAFDVLRNGKHQKVTVKLEATPSSGEQAKKSRQKELEFSVREISRQDRIENRGRRNVQGLIVTDVVPGSWAQMAGLQVDDIIVEINHKQMPTVAAFDAEMKRLMKERPRTIEIYVKRGYRTHFVFIEPDWTHLMNK